MTLLHWGVLALVGAVGVVWLLICACAEFMNGLMDDEE